MPVLALGAEYIPAFGGISNPTAVLGMQQLAENVQGIIVPNSGHFIAEEQIPSFVLLRRGKNARLLRRGFL